MVQAGEEDAFYLIKLGAIRLRRGRRFSGAASVRFARWCNMHNHTK